MPTLPDARRDKLVQLGYTGHTNDMELQYLRERLNAAANQINDAWLEVANVPGEPANYVYRTGATAAPLSVTPAFTFVEDDWAIGLGLNVFSIEDGAGFFAHAGGAETVSLTRTAANAFSIVASAGFGGANATSASDVPAGSVPITLLRSMLVVDSNTPIAPPLALQTPAGNTTLIVGNMAAWIGSFTFDDGANPHTFPLIVTATSVPTITQIESIGGTYTLNLAGGSWEALPSSQANLFNVLPVRNTDEINQAKINYFMMNGGMGADYNALETSFWKNLAAPAADSHFVVFNIEAGALTLNLPLQAGQTYNFVVDWGDGNSETITADTASHTYAEAGTYRVAISGTFPRWFFNNTPAAAQLVDMPYWGNIQLTGLSNNAFADLVNLRRLPIDIPDLSNVTSFINGFMNAGIRSFDGRGWDVSGITRFDGFLINCANLEYIRIDGWQWASNVRMNSFASGCTSLVGVTSEGIGAFPANRIDGMFFDCANLVDIDVSHWDVSQVQNINNMFSGCTSLVNLDISRWDISSVTTANGFLNGVEIRTDIYTATLIYWATLSLNSGLNLDMGDATYEASAQAARDAILAMGVTIQDGGPA